MRIIGIMSCLRARKFTFLCGIGEREHTTTNPFVTGISNYVFTGLQPGDLTASMLVVKNKSISLLGELKPIFM